MSTSLEQLSSIELKQRVIAQGLPVPTYTTKKELICLLKSGAKENDSVGFLRPVSVKERARRFSGKMEKSALPRPLTQRKRLKCMKIAEPLSPDHSNSYEKDDEVGQASQLAGNRAVISPSLQILRGRKLLEKLLLPPT